MDGIDGFQAERVFDLEETIFVAVGKNLEKSKRLIFWVLQSFTGKKICLLYVHQTANVFSFTDRKLAVSKQEEDAVKVFQELEKKKINDVLDQYSLILAQEGVQADRVWIEMDNIDQGIVEIISRYNIRWLVMGAAADKYYSKKLGELKSKKAIFVCQKAPNFCHIWFVCKGCLIYTRAGRDYGPEPEIALPPLLSNSDSETEQPRLLGPESCSHLHESLDTEEVADDMEENSGRFDRQCSVHSCQSTNATLCDSKLIPLLVDEEEKAQLQTTGETCSRLEQVTIDAKELKQKVFVEAVKRWKEEDCLMEAKCKAKALESLCIKKISTRKEMEEALARKREEVEKAKNQRDESVKELQMVQEQKSVLENQMAESRHMVEELEEKIISAVQLLISFKERRDAARVEYKNAVQEVMRLNRSAKAASSCNPELLAFAFMEITEATHNFDPSWKIGEGRHGSVYKGILRHLHVAIKMFPSYGSHGHLEFQNWVEILSRVRHPNLVKFVGTCPESRSLVYEYVRNGSLDDHLSGKVKTPLPWQTRIHIAIHICSGLIFLHSNKPCIIHGNLKPSKVLLDTNFVSKLTDSGIFHLIPQTESSPNSTRMCETSNPSFTSLYMDPEYLETGKLTPESDVYSFGIILLQLLTGRPAIDIVKDVTCALEKQIFKTVLDSSGGDWPLEEAKQLAHLALRCRERNQLDRPDLALILRVLEPMKASGIASASKEPKRTPSHFVCPILQEVMDDPQIAADGFTYDAEAIRGWLKSGHNTSPMTNLKLEHSNLVPNHALHQAILEWRQHWYNLSVV